MSEVVKPKDRSEQRTLLAIALCMGVFWVWSAFFAPPPPEPEAGTAAEVAALPAVAQITPSAPASFDAPVATGEPCTDARETLQTSAFSVSVSDCGSVRAIDLPGLPAPLTVTPWWSWIYAKGSSLFGTPDPGPWVPYLRTADHEALLGPSGTLLAAGRGEIGPAPATKSTVTRTGESLTWSRTEGPLTTTQTLAPGPSPDLLDVTVTWSGDRPLSGPFWVSVSDTLAPAAGIYDMNLRLEATSDAALDPLLNPEELLAPRTLEGPAQWIGIGDRYFLAALVAAPDSPGTIRYAPIGVPSEKASTHPVGVYYVADTTQIDANKPLVARFQLFVGPKQFERVTEIGGGLEHAVDLGFFGFFARIILFTLDMFRGIIPSWGLSIIALTFLVRASLYPLAAKAFKSGKAMQAIQPKVKELQALYADDKEKQSQETMKLFKEHGVNPLGGCLPMLVQIPVFFALIAGLNASPDLYGAPFLYLQDLSMQDPYGVLAVLIIAGMYMQQQLMPMTGMDPNQVQMLKFMPIIFGVLMFSNPAGLSVYYVINTFLSILQQWYNTRDNVVTPSGPAPDSKVAPA